MCVGQKHHVNIAEPGVSATINCSARIPQDSNSCWVFKDQSTIIATEFARMTSEGRDLYPLISRLNVAKSMACASAPQSHAYSY
jgi:hypothetical protein